MDKIQNNGISKYMSEVWKDIKGYEGLYQVSNTGKVRSINYNHTGKIKQLKTADNGLGYIWVSLFKNKICKRYYIHRLVVEAFIGEISKGFVVNHKDENKYNNNVDNLEIVTQSYNVNYGSRNSVVSNKLSGIKRSEKTKLKMIGNKNSLGHKVSIEARNKISIAHKGKTLSEEHKQKLSISHKGKPWSQARRDAQNKTISHLTQI